MDNAEKCDVINEYDVDDPAIQNIMQEINPEGDGGAHVYMNRISELLESIEARKINGLMNFIIYGMILDEGQGMVALEKINNQIEEFMVQYHSSLDEIEDALAISKNLKVTIFSDLINEIRMDKTFYKTHKKDIDKFIKKLPDMKQNLEFISRVLLGM